MSAAPEQTVGRWLSSMDIKISSALLKEAMQTHPDYPSLLSITDTLDELGIDNAALVINYLRIAKYGKWFAK